MKERPILFSAPMVRALLDGKKTQTRRVVKPQPVLVSGSVPFRPLPPRLVGVADPARGVLYRSRYGKAGDRLWVRETWCEAHPLAFQEGRIGHRLLYAGIPGPPPVDYLVAYRADGELLPVFHNDGGGHPYRQREPADEFTRKNYPRGHEYGWMPSIYMPRKASRITLEITGVRVERLQDISEEDSLAEGVEALSNPFKGCFACGPAMSGTTARECYRRLWESINGEGSWDANPWVWVVSFRRVPT